jgi:polyphosphate kinase 2 (PPK2 family)
MARQPAHRRQVGAGANKSLSKREYRRHLTALELELNNVARWLQTTGRHLVVLIEGRDTAGKGGVVAAIAARLNLNPAVTPRPPTQRAELSG